MRIEDYYSQFALAYFSERQSTASFAARPISEFFEGIPPLSTVLDVGCGPGVEATRAQGWGHNIIGLDSALGMIEVFRQNVPTGTALCADMRRIPLLDHSVDCIFSTCSILHLGRSEGIAALTEFKRVSKPYGRALIATTIHPGSCEELYTHRVAALQNLDPVFFYHWDHSDLCDQLQRLDYKILDQNVLTLIEGRPPVAFITTALDWRRIGRGRWLSMGTSWRQETIEHASRIAYQNQDAAGVSRLSRIDRLGGFDVPVYSASRPSSKIAITVSSGKGTTVDESRMSALFEALEIASAEHPVPFLETQFDQLPACVPRVDPSHLGAIATGDLWAWTPVFRLSDAKPYWCPTVAVSMLDHRGPFLPNTSGLASGCSLHEALLHGILELLERHAHSVALVRRSGRSLDLNSLADGFVQTVANQCEDLSLRLEVKDLTDITGVPTYYALIFDRDEKDTLLFGGGSGAHLDSTIALRRAVAEAVQSRSLVIAGAREDVRRTATPEGCEPARDTFGYWYESTGTRVSLRTSLTTPSQTYSDEAIDQVIRLARETDSSLGEVYYFVFPSPPGTWVVRCIFEGAELFAVDRSRIGHHVRDVAAQCGLEIDRLEDVQ